MLNRTAESTPICRTGKPARRTPAAWTSAAVFITLVLLVCGGASSPASEPPFSPASHAVAIETRDGLVNATFAEPTDNAVLKSAIPYLIANGVRSVSLRGAPITDITPLTSIPDLIALDLEGTQVRDLSPLADLAGLRSLNLQFLRVGSLKPLSGLTHLRTLNIEGSEVQDLTPIASLTDLQELSAAVTTVKDLAPIMRLRQLRSLNLGSTWVSDLRPLTEMTDLHLLNLNGTQVGDLRPLAHMMKMQTLDLGGTRVADVTPLANLRDLRSLNLESTAVTDVTPLAGLNALGSVALGGSRVRDTTPLTHLAAAPGGPPNQATVDPVLDWNDQTNRAIQATGTDAFEASHGLAIESIAVLDTIKSLDGTPAFLVRLTPPADVSVNVAVAAAAHAVLRHLFPLRQPMLDATLTRALAQEPPGPALDNSLAFGKAVADAVIMLRDGDGSMDTGPRPEDTQPEPKGAWRPTAPEFLPPAHPRWGTTQPFALTRSDQFRPEGPPSPQSDAFREARATVEELGARDSTLRTPEQTEIAHYWSDAIGTYAPAGHWNAIAANFVAPLHLGLAVEAELFAELNVALADAGIAMADAKYTYWSSRPITVIRDNASLPNPGWTPLLNTPNHPSYVSGHSSFSGAAASVLTTWFGSHPFTFTSASLPGVMRYFTSFQQAAEEAAASRVYGGIHFPFDNADGLAIGRSVGAWTMGVFQQLAQDRGPVVIMMDRSMPMANIDPHAFVGCALDNVSPVNAVTVRLDGGAPFTVSVNDHGFFTLPPDRVGQAGRSTEAGPAGRHTVIVTATSITGRSSITQVKIE